MEGETIMNGWTVEQTAYANGTYVALAEDSDSQTPYTLFTSTDCTTWSEAPLPASVGSGTQLTSVSYVENRWIVTGGTQEDGELRHPILMMGRDPEHLSDVPLDGLKSVKAHRYLYSMAENRREVLALGYDLERGPSQQEDVAYPVIFERAKAIRIPFRDSPFYNPSYSNVDLPPAPPDTL
jgi:hypothetical protein